ncbi:MAG: hypothetical protein ACU85U_05815 [Gammaproteobacteria bacterium]
MSLETKLAEIRDASATRIPAEKREVMHAETAKLRDSGIVGKAIQVGDPLPPFTLENQNGDMISSVALLKQGAVVLTVFRGHW